MHTSLNRLFRRLRERHDAAEKARKKSSALFSPPPPPSDQQHGGIVSGCCSRKTSSTLSHMVHVHQHHHHKEQQQPTRKGSGSSAKCPFVPSGAPYLPDPLLHRIFDAVENPFELFPLRRVNRASAKYVKSKIESVSEMDLRRVSFDELSSSSTGTSAQSETSVILRGELWYVHPSGCKVLCRVCPVELPNGSSSSGGSDCNKSEVSENGREQSFRLEVLVDEQWTSREIAVLCSLVNEFRQVLRRISLDAPIFELIVANLAAVDLDRWFAYQCFVKAVDEGQMNAALNKLAAQLQDDTLEMANESELYWPNAKTILVRTTERESVHLARVLNYGVRSHLVMDRRRLDRLSLQVCVADAAQLHVSMAERPKQLVRNLYHFRCWAGSPGFDERFHQQWRCVSRSVA